MRTSVASVALAMSFLLACGKPDAKNADSMAVMPQTPPTADTYAVLDFQRLRWMNGMWRGFMPDGKTFYERYRVLDDSTMVMHAFPDSTFGAPSDSSRILLRGGVVSNESGSARWVATRLDSTSVDFAPQRGAVNHFTWAQETPTQWNATLRWTDQNGRAQSIMYAIHRFGR